METLRVCLSTADFPPFSYGGLARYSSGLFKELKSLGLDVTLIAPVPERDFAYQDNTIASFRLPFYNNRVLKYPFFNVLSLRRKLEKRYDIIHSLSTQHEIGLSRIATNNVVLTVNNTFAQQLEMPYSNPGLDRVLRRGFYAYMSLWERIACRSVKKIIAISRGTKASLISSYGISSDKIDVIYCGIDLKKFREKKPINPEFRLDDGYFLYVGRIVPRKGLEYALRAFQLVKRKIGSSKLVIIGRGEKRYLDMLVRLARQLRIDRDVFFLGNVSDEELSAFYHGASLFVFPSLVEGFGLVCAEAMACGKPVVASDIPGVREVVINGETGFLVPPRNYIELANAILRLTDSVDLMNRLSSNASRQAERFSWRRNAREVYACYKDIAS